MSLPQQITAYADCAELFEKAASDGRGLRYFVEDFSGVKTLQMRMHQYRKLDRDEKKRIYDKTDRRWGISEWDKYTVRVRPTAEGNHITPQGQTIPIFVPDGWWMYVELTVADMSQAEGLSELEA